MEPLIPVSRLFVSPGFYGVIVFTLGFKTRCNSSAIVEGIKNTWIKLPRFSSKVVMDDKKNGEAVWVPVSVRVEDHVFVPEIDHSNITIPDQFIEDYTSNIANTPMDMSTPLWEFHVLNIKTSNAESLGIGKFHHSLGDGIKISDPNALPTTATTRKQVGPNNNWWLVARFWFMIRVIFTTFIELFKSLLTLCYMRDTKTPLMGKPGDRNGPRKIIHRIISFDDVKFVKNTMKMKVNDVFLGITQADQDPVTTKKRSLEETRLRGTIAVNLRPDTKIKDLADMMTKGSKCRWGNFIDKIIINLAVDTTVIPDPHQLCDDLIESLDIIKLSLMEKGLYKMEVFDVHTI
ncbi:hypothetical protein Bca4012_017969 [Brassica carinata]|uniref:Diacylglycerol O-acyltransferase n=1 Tax=Brassica carinata TaxID=52824 RepID=A0A8X7WP69_BRACI|nr:hypothetical protein Bca52824_003640 [Brassica carinata]